MGRNQSQAEQRGRSSSSVMKKSHRKWGKTQLNRKNDLRNAVCGRESGNSGVLRFRGTVPATSVIEFWVSDETNIARFALRAQGDESWWSDGGERFAMNLIGAGRILTEWTAAERLHEFAPFVLSYLIFAGHALQLLFTSFSLLRGYCQQTGGGAGMAQSVMRRTRNLQTNVEVRLEDCVETVMNVRMFASC